MIFRHATIPHGETLYIDCCTQYLHVIEASLEGLAVHGGLVAAVCDLNEVVHLVGKHTVEVGIAGRWVTPHATLTSYRLLQSVQRTRVCISNYTPHSLHTTRTACFPHYLSSPAVTMNTKIQKNTNSTACFPHYLSSPAVTMNTKIQKNTNSTACFPHYTCICLSSSTVTGIHVVTDYCPNHNLWSLIQHYTRIHVH